MWSKLAASLKSRTGTDDSAQDARPATLTPDVMGSVREAHPNLCVLSGLVAGFPLRIC
jgi:hypothetical protein